MTETDRLAKVAQYEVDLENLDATLMDLATGKKVGTLTVGSGEFQRRYEYNELTVPTVEHMLKRRKEELRVISKTPETAVQFRASHSDFSWRS